jgi:hypothetical protein
VLRYDTSEGNIHEEVPLELEGLMSAVAVLVGLREHA